MLKENVTRHVEFQRSLGFKFHSQNALLTSFASYAESCGDEIIQVQTVLDWAGLAPSPQQRRNRLLTVRRFALVLKAEDDRHQIPPTEAFGNQPFIRCRPHIYSSGEISAILKAAAQLTPENPIRSTAYTTLFALLVATGLRISEALALKLEDITEDGLIVQKTKFRKSRLVPLHETTCKGLNRYLVQRNRLRTTNTAVFVSHTGKPICYSTVVTVFLKLIRSIGLRKGLGHPGPRLHDLRHTFAVRSLEQCSGDSMAIKTHMTALSTYLGHAHISDTYWYLQATPKLMGQIAMAGETLFTGVQS